METHFEILIDASGSMGFMKGSTQENQCLLPDGSTRTDLVKKILINNILPNLNFLNALEINRFRGYTSKDKNNKIINYKDTNNPVIYIYRKIIFNGVYNLKQLTENISKIPNPPIGATPIYSALIHPIAKNKTKQVTLILITDGDSNDIVDFDEKLINEITKNNYKVKIFIIGIDQDEIAQRKCKHITKFTDGHYVNLESINYNSECFDSLLFELKASITSSELSKISDINEVIDVEKPSTDNNENNEKIGESKSVELSEKVAENSKSLQLISTQLDNIVNELKYLRTSKNSSELTNDFEFNEDEEYNKKIGWKCENFLHKHFQKNNWEEVLWLNEKEEQGSPFDIRIKDKGEYFFIECKGTTTSSKEFYLTKNEWNFYLENRRNYRLYFVSEINSNNPKITRIEDLISSLEKSELTPFSSINRKLKADRTIFQINN